MQWVLVYGEIDLGLTLILVWDVMVLVYGEIDLGLTLILGNYCEDRDGEGRK